MTSTSISAEGWYARVVPHPDASTFRPTIDNLLFMHRRSAQRGGGLVMALFLPDVAVDSDGNVLKVQPQDFAILATLIEDVARLPDTGRYKGVWPVASAATCRPNDYLAVKTPEGSLKETGVYAWSAQHGSGYAYSRLRASTIFSA